MWAPRSAPHAWPGQLSWAASAPVAPSIPTAIASHKLAARDARQDYLQVLQDPLRAVGVLRERRVPNPAGSASLVRQGIIVLILD